MSRVGKKPIEIPAGVTVTVNGNTVTVKGPKGELTRTFHPDMTITVEGNVITVTRPSMKNIIARSMARRAACSPTWSKAFRKVMKKRSNSLVSGTGRRNKGKSLY
ncbi:50S ribosomal protein L6 [Geobacillus sp. BCO2]|nr:50S ribosomal protein L6 [Geobacillus sp. BCO2]